MTTRTRLSHALSGRRRRAYAPLVALVFAGAIVPAAISATPEDATATHAYVTAVYQVVRGPSPIPVSLTELDAHGRALRVVKLVPVVECTKHPLKYLDGGPHTLVHGSVPGGPPFSIAAERYRFLGKVYFEFDVHVAVEPGTGARGVGSGGTFFAKGERPAFAPEEDFGCGPRFYDIVYGLLKPPGTTWWSMREASSRR